MMRLWAHEALRSFTDHRAAEGDIATVMQTLQSQLADSLGASSILSDVEAAAGTEEGRLACDATESLCYHNLGPVRDHASDQLLTSRITRTSCKQSNFVRTA